MLHFLICLFLFVLFVGEKKHPFKPCRFFNRTHVDLSTMKLRPLRIYCLTETIGWSDVQESWSPWLACQDWRPAGGPRQWGPDPRWPLTGCLGPMEGWGPPGGQDTGGAQARLVLGPHGGQGRGGQGRREDGWFGFHTEAHGWNLVHLLHIRKVLSEEKNQDDNLIHISHHATKLASTIGNINKLKVNNSFSTYLLQFLCVCVYIFSFY